MENPNKNKENNEENNKSKSNISLLKNAQKEFVLNKLKQDINYFDLDNSNFS